MIQGKRWRKRTVVLATTAASAVTLGAAVAAAASGASNTPLGDKPMGPQPDGSYLVQTNQFVRPVGQVITDKGRPFGLALRPDGKTAAALNNGGGTTGMVSVFDLTSHTVLQHYGNGRKSNGGIVYSPDGTKLWATQPGGLTSFDVASDGTLSNQKTHSLPGANGRQPVPAGLTFAPDGRTLLVTLSANNTLGEFDTSTGTLTRQIPVGNVPNSVVVVGGQAYVSNQGGRPATSSDQTDNSYGTPVVTNNDSAVPSTGTVSDVDLATGQQVKTFAVGLGPSAMLAVGKEVLVTNSDDDSVTSIDTSTQQVGRTFSVNPAPGAPFGASPDGLAMLDPGHLAVSLGRDNAVAVYTYSNSMTQPGFDGLIPAGSYPSGIAFDETLKRLVIASEQGIGSATGPYGTINEGQGTSPAPGSVSSHIGYNFVGTVQTVASPTSQEMQQWTQQVFADNQWNGLADRNQLGGPGHAQPVPVPIRIGDPSTIKHVFLIVKENRTYDQVFGDDPRGNGDPTLAQFGQSITPNTHALATQFPLIDNVYSDGTNSAEGHHWLTQASVNNYMQQMYGSYTRSYQTADPMSDVKTGWIWENAQQHGKSVVNYGEQIDRYTDSHDNGTASNSWDKWMHDANVLADTEPGPLNYPLGTYTAKTDIPSLAKVTVPDFPNFDLNIPDQYRAALWRQYFAQYNAASDHGPKAVPDLSMIWLMNDHTEGTSPGGVAPVAHVADNDLALGKIVDTISHSSIWKDSAIFVIEDDSQNGVDHVDGHRNPTLVISPWARRGAVVHTYYSQLNVIRTIEQILGLPPMNQQDLTAEPMYDVFTKTPDNTPYTYLPESVSLDQRNPTAAALTSPSAAASATRVGQLELAWAQWSQGQDWRSEDMVNMAEGNRDIWYAGHNFAVPYPGDSAVLFPWQVPGASGTPDRHDG